MFEKAELTIHGKTKTIAFYCLDLLWKPVKENIRFVLVVDGTDRFILMCSDLELSPQDIISIYCYRSIIETFFAWWKRHLKVYHIIARSEHGLLVQILSGLITYLLLAIYCQKHYGERVTIKRFRELRIKIQNDLRDAEQKPLAPDSRKPTVDILHASG